MVVVPYITNVSQTFDQSKFVKNRITQRSLT